LTESVPNLSVKKIELNYINIRINLTYNNLENTYILKKFIVTKHIFTNLLRLKYETNMN